MTDGRSNAAKSKGKRESQGSRKSHGSSEERSQTKSKGEGCSSAQSWYTETTSSPDEEACSRAKSPERSGAHLGGWRRHDEPQRRFAVNTPEFGSSGGRRQLLPSRVHGGWAGQGTYSPRRAACNSLEAHRYTDRRHSSLARTTSGERTTSASMSSRVQSGDGRGHHCPRDKAKEALQGRGRGSMDLQPEGRTLERRGRRFSSPQSQRCHSERGRRSSLERKGRQRQRRGGEDQGQEEKEERQGREERKEGEEKEKEGEEFHFRRQQEAEWDQGKEGISETSQDDLRWNGGGPSRQGAGAGAQARSPLSEEERGENQLKFVLWGNRGQHFRGRSRSGGVGCPILPRQQGQDGGGGVSGSFVRTSISSDAGGSAPEPGRGGQARSLQRSGDSVLQAGLGSQGQWPNGPRVVVHHNSFGLPRQREGCVSLRSAHSAGQEPGADSPRRALDGGTETRGIAWRPPRCDRTSRVEGSSEGHLRDDPIEVSSLSAGREAERKRSERAERRRQGRSRTRRPWEERRKECPREGRPWKEEGRRRGQVLEGLPLSAPRTALWSFGTGVDEVLGAVGNSTAGSASEISDVRPGLYEEGKALALQKDDLEAALQRSSVDLGNGVESLQQSVQEAFSASISPGDLPMPVTQPTGRVTDGFSPETQTFNRDRRVKKADESQPLSGKPLGETGNFLLQKLLEVLPLRSKSTGRREKTALFPLPTSRAKLQEVFPSLTVSEVDWLVTLCVCLNSFWGDEIFYEGTWNKAVTLSMEKLVKEVKRFCAMPTEVPLVDWNALFAVKSIDYKGDEVQVARWFSWANVGPALPKEVGRVPLAEVCTLGSKHYVEHFDQYLKPQAEWGKVPRPRVMVSDEDWCEVCTGLVSSGVCTLITEEEIFHTSEGPLLNGMFGVTKDEFTDSGVEIYRLIMNLIPLNRLCRPMSGDVDTLPSWSSMNPFFLQPTDNLLVSSEDVKCFFYTMSVPQCWIKFLAFNKPVPPEALPCDLQGKSVFLASKVLPMGFLNSVSLAQHVHRNLVSWSGQDPAVNPPQAELRKDRPISVGQSNWRVYLDNFDLLEKVSKTEMVSMEGSCPAGVLALRNQYEVWGVPRNLKKAVERSSSCELQGATIDGEAGCAYPREGKLAKYFGLALSLCQQITARQRQWQVVCGGLVYISMFRRPLLGCLNRVWAHIESYNSAGRELLTTPPECRLEILRFLGLLPLGRMNFRLDMHEAVTCSDASTKGGGACCSTSLTSVGHMVAQGALHGEVPEDRGEFSVLCIGLFDGISALRVALDLLGVQVLGHVSIDKHQPAQRVVGTHYPDTIFVDSVEEVTPHMVQDWATRFSQSSLVLIGAGPPCQGVSGLNFDRKGALADQRSNLFTHVPRITQLVKEAFAWCPVERLMESVASMDKQDRDTMSAGVGCKPLLMQVTSHGAEGLACTGPHGKSGTLRGTPGSKKMMRFPFSD